MASLVMVTNTMVMVIMIIIVVVVVVDMVVMPVVVMMIVIPFVRETAPASSVRQVWLEKQGAVVRGCSQS